MSPGYGAQCMASSTRSSRRWSSPGRRTPQNFGASVDQHQWKASSCLQRLRFEQLCGLHMHSRLPQGSSHPQRCRACCGWQQRASRQGQRTALSIFRRPPEVNMSCQRFFKSAMRSIGSTTFIFSASGLLDAHNMNSCAKHVRIYTGASNARLGGAFIVFKGESPCCAPTQSRAQGRSPAGLGARRDRVTEWDGAGGERSGERSAAGASHRVREGAGGECSAPQVPWCCPVDFQTQL